MNWININTPPNHNNDVLLSVNDGDGYWIEAKFDDGKWKNKLGDDIHAYQLSKVTHWTEVELLKQTA